RDGVLIDDSADLILNRCDDQLMKGETKHLIVVLSVPIAYPRLVLRGLRMFSRVGRVIP
ncbi:hypothetical protein I7I51_01402, partial [Histoplasma capsulatum]